MTNHEHQTSIGADSGPDPPLRPPVTLRLRPWHWVAIDSALALLFATVFVVASTDAAHGISRGVAYAVALASTLPVAARRRWPRGVLTVVLAGSVAAMVIGTGTVAPVVVAFTLYLVTLQFSRRTSSAALISAVLATTAGTIAGVWVGGSQEIVSLASQIVASSVVITAGWVIGAALRAQRAYAAGLIDQADRRAQDRLTEARRAVVEERLRIARELHDVVAHSLSVITLQAGVGGYVAESRPDEATRVLASIEVISRTALREMRQLLGILRGTDTPEPDLGPMPGLPDLDQLTANTTAAGVQVNVEIRGAERAIPPGMSLAAYRIVQEALTNVVKHAHVTTCRVTVTYDEDALIVEITDDGQGVSGLAPTTGHGIAGMVERTNLYGGEFHAGPLPKRGFRVAARLPLVSTAIPIASTSESVRNGTA